MKRFSVATTLVLSCTTLFAQDGSISAPKSILYSEAGFAQRSDTTSFSRDAFRPAVEVAFGGAGEPITPQIELQQLMALSNSTVLTRDYGNFESASNYYSVNSQLFFAMNLYKPLRNIRRLSISWGILVREHQYAGVYYQSDTLFPVDVLRGDSMGHVVIQYYSNTMNRSIAVTGNQLYIPIGINWCTNSEKLLWFQAGLNLAPGVSAGHVIHHDFSSHTQYIYAPAGSDPKDYRYTPGFQNGPISENHILPLKGTGFACYASLPLKLYFRFSRTIPGFNRLSLLAAAEPLLSYHSFKGLQGQAFFSARFGVGLRCRV